MLEAPKWWRQSAEQGFDKAQFNLGRCCENGWGVARDITEAVKWYRRSADQGHGKAQYAAGCCYYMGSGAEKNDAEAVKWFRMAAEQGNDKSQYNRGVGYCRGMGGLGKDNAEARKWFLKARRPGEQRRAERAFRTRRLATQMSESSVRTGRRRQTGQAEKFHHGRARTRPAGSAAPSDQARFLKRVHHTA
ncbi:MAG: sel1 repeat family protein [Thermoguttaceae bacterium]|nr:sel1 repeat family protein [Thermoguttaceae bacterium]